ncbi:MAG: hypothetical protein JNL32_04990 [Candidatus Kapabacteria bacterium]|nr:hypothetical protein [Candidatus Kapabacteria bacterium]
MKTLVLTAIAFFALALCSSTSFAQSILTNNGTLIYVSPKTTVRICGTADVVSNGTVTVQDSANLRVDGTMNITNGTLNLNAASTALVTVDLTSGGTPCGPATGTINRNGTGTLRVNRNLNNNGLLNNTATILIFGDWNNAGTANNDNLIEINQP